MKAIGYISTTVILMVLSSLYSGYALAVMWGWFMVPGLGLPSLSVGYAIGVTMIVGFLTHRTTSDKDERPFAKQLATGAVIAAGKPTLALMCGWVVTLFL